MKGIIWFLTFQSVVLVALVIAILYQVLVIAPEQRQVRDDVQECRDDVRNLIDSLEGWHKVETKREKDLEVARRVVAVQNADIAVKQRQILRDTKEIQQRLEKIREKLD